MGKTEGDRRESKRRERDTEEVKEGELRQKEDIMENTRLGKG